MSIQEMEETYIVTFQVPPGQECNVEFIEVVANGTINDIPIPKRQGYNFEYWASNGIEQIKRAIPHFKNMKYFKWGSSAFLFL